MNGSAFKCHERAKGEAKTEHYFCAGEKMDPIELAKRDFALKR